MLLFGQRTSHGHFTYVSRLPVGRVHSGGCCRRACDRSGGLRCRVDHRGRGGRWGGGQRRPHGDLAAMTRFAMRGIGIGDQRVGRGRGVRSQGLDRNGCRGGCAIGRPGGIGCRSIRSAACSEGKDEQGGGEKRAEHVRSVGRQGTCTPRAHHRCDPMIALPGSDLTTSTAGRGWDRSARVAGPVFDRGASRRRKNRSGIASCRSPPPPSRSWTGATDGAQWFCRSTFTIAKPALVPSTSRTGIKRPDHGQDECAARDRRVTLAKTALTPASGSSAPPPHSPPLRMRRSRQSAGRCP